MERSACWAKVASVPERRTQLVNLSRTSTSSRDMVFNRKVAKRSEVSGAAWQPLRVHTIRSQHRLTKLE
eukprot:1175626-Amphidinium_carterae.2